MKHPMKHRQAALENFTFCFTQKMVWKILMDADASAKIDRVNFLNAKHIE
jgi:hypothetical protein